MTVPNYITPTRQEEIDRLLSQILLVLGKSYPEDNLVDIIRAYIPGVTIGENDFDGDTSIRGAIYKKSDEFKEPLIVIQQQLSPAAKTFALAHEFAHYALNHPGKANFLLDKVDYDGTTEKQREAEAQYFAASLLMPKDVFEKLGTVLTDGELAERFGVSVSAIRVRRKWLNGHA